MNMTANNLIGIRNIKLSKAMSSSTQVKSSLLVLNN
jgi:hypothetical protein